jgi:predicted Fe-Mo cluster-binding NifX family protein
VKVAIPRFGEEVAPCFEYSATIAIFTIEQSRIANQTDFVLQSQQSFDRFRLLRDQGVDTLICGGVENRFEDLIRDNGIEVISWVVGNVDELLNLFIKGRLISGTGRIGSNGAKPKGEN